jgi:hypothetical protein
MIGRGNSEVPPVDPKPSTTIFIWARVYRARDPRHSRNGGDVRFALDRTDLHDLRAFALGDAHRSLQGEVLRPCSAEVGSSGIAQAACSATDPAAGRGSHSRRGNGSRGRTGRHGARCGPAAVATCCGQAREPAVERVCGALSLAGISTAVRSAPALLLAGEGPVSFGVFAVCGSGLVAGRAGSLDWMEGAGSGAAVELGGGEHALAFISLGPPPQLGQQSIVAGRRADPQRLAAALRVRAGVAGDLRGGGAVPGHMLSGGQLDSPGSDARRRTDGASQSVSLGAAGDLRVSVGSELSIVSAGEERWSSPVVSSDGEKS